MSNLNEELDKVVGLCHDDAVDAYISLWLCGGC